MFWLAIRILLLLVFLFSVIQLYLDPNVGYVITVLVSFTSFISIKDPIVQAVEKLNSPSQKDVDESITALKAINSFASRMELERVMRYHKNPTVRLKAAVAMAELGHKRALNGLLPHLPDPVSVDALKFIKKIENKHLRKQLISKLKDEEQDTVIHELGRLGGIDAAEYIRKRIRFMANQPEKASISATVEAINQASSMKDVEIIPSLLIIFEFVMIKRKEYESWGNLFQGHLQATEKILDAIVKAMGSIGDPRSTNSLAKVVLNSDLSSESIQEEAIDALSKIGDKRAVEVLMECLDGALAEQAHGLSGEKCLKGKNLAIKVIASIDALKKRETAWVLIKALEVNDENVRREAEKALRGILSSVEVDELVSALPSIDHIDHPLSPRGGERWDLE